MAVCSDCGGTVIEYDQAAGNGFCVTCGTVVEENTIVNEIAFGETANGAAIVQGSFVAQGATHARMGGPYGNRSGSDSREQTIENVLSEVVVLAARRMYTLAVEHKFTKGRKSLDVVAVCLYVACRQKETRNYMLIDFSDLLQVNVFELGHTYLQLVQILNLRLPLVDLSHYISRFAALLEFGDETHKVATDAVRLVQRFGRDWMTKGRRPAGICGAALLLAARMNNFRRSIEEIVQVVKIADTTLKKRLDEFKATPSGSLTLADFRSVWLDEEMDPPAFTRGKEREEAERKAVEAGVNGITPGTKEKGKKRKGKRKRGEESDEDDVPDFPPQVPLGVQPPRVPVDPAILQHGILAGAIDSITTTKYRVMPGTDAPTLSLPPTDFVDETVSNVLAEEVSTFLQNPQGAKLSEALDEAERRRLAQMTMADELMGLDEEELNRFILSEDEVRIKERAWVELNRDYLEAIAAKGYQQDSAAAAKSRKKRKSNKPRDATTPSGSTAAESVRNLIKKNPKYSKRINYGALKDLFVVTNAPPSFSQSLKAISDDKDEDGLYTMSAEDGNGEEGGASLVIIEVSGVFFIAFLPLFLQGRRGACRAAAYFLSPRQRAAALLLQTGGTGHSLGVSRDMRLTSTLLWQFGCAVRASICDPPTSGATSRGLFACEPYPARASVFAAADSSPRLQQLIAANLDGPFAAEIRAIAGAPAGDDAGIIREAFTLLLNKHSTASPELQAALATRKSRKKRMQNTHHDTVRELGLDWSPADIERWNSALPTIRLPKLKTPFPEPGKYVCEDEAIKSLWNHRLMEARQADKRLKRCEPVVIDLSRLTRDVQVTEDLVIRDSGTGEIVLMVVRHFSRNIDTIDWMEDIVAEATEICRNIRKEDPGHLSIAGFSAGSRSQPQFHWARNIIRKLPPEAAFDFRLRQSYAFALFWNMLLKRLPAEIMDEWNGWIDQEMLPGMHPSWTGGGRGDTAGECIFPVYNGHVKLSAAKYAPPAGVMAQNYSRAVHFEKQPHKWAASHTLSRDYFADHDGGHFYLAAYGVRVMSAPDSLIVWQPGHHHGTSLQRLDPNETDPRMIQRGMSFVTSSRLPTIWRRYVLELQKIEAEKISETAKEKKAREAAASCELALARGDDEHAGGDDCADDGDIYFLGEEA
ncbi:hypothetical protein Agabi119p4_1102 [Agaricus bisporus var. burnettii]|uniref:B-related factor 1 n=1 Tax=Agaricus bisporus var. burnettii TaxID=192524 RepID=A0A8H7FBT1_AGABI|nr:hypothetical protein Agabi119p4_1102 [Agaricus bisporus var. burnettii]